MAVRVRVRVYLRRGIIAVSGTVGMSIGRRRGRSELATRASNLQPTIQRDSLTLRRYCSLYGRTLAPTERATTRRAVAGPGSVVQ